MAITDIHVKVDSGVKNESEKVLKGIGISVSDLINMTLRRVIYERRIPFDTQLPDFEMPDELSVSSEEELRELIENRLTHDDGSRRSLKQVRQAVRTDRALA